MGVAVGFIHVGECHITGLRRAVAVEVAYSIDSAMSRERNGMQVLAQSLEPDNIVGLAAINLIAHCARTQFIVVVADVGSLIAIRIVVVDTLAVAVAPERVVAIHTDHIAGVVAIENLAAIVAYPTAESSTLAVAGDASGIEAVVHLDATLAPHAHAADTGSILL